MCIRDRCPPYAWFYDTDACEKSSPVMFIIAAVVIMQPQACLLYTSDAADDLLCVDLGGRRIIKKTNNNT